MAAQEVWGSEHEVTAFCDNNAFCQQVLRKHWPNANIYDDIRTIKGRDLGAVDLVTGGFPCQPFSQAGKRRGTKDDRYLWPEMLRVIREIHPAWVIGENVAGIISLALEDVCVSLEDSGYEVQPFIIPACAVSAPHRRDRIWIIAYSQGANDRGNTGELSKADEWKKKERQEKRIAELGGTNDDIENAIGKRWRGRRNGNTRRRRWPLQAQRPNTAFHRWKESWLEVAARLCSVDDGLFGGLVRPKGWRNAALKAAGNAIVPQVAREIMHAVKIIDEL